MLKKYDIGSLSEEFHVDNMDQTQFSVHIMPKSSSLIIS
jgi:hypothetical protein